MMATIQLHSDCPNSITYIPNSFIDQYMPDANGEFVKVYLYLLRKMQDHSSEISVSAIADCFNHTEKDVLRALKYWERMHLILLEYGSDKALSGIRFLAPVDNTANYSAAGMISSEPPSSPSGGSGADPQHAAASIPAPASPAPSAAPKKSTHGSGGVISKTTSRRDYTLDEVTHFKADPNISELFFIIETYLKHPMAATDINTVLYWYDELHFSTELIVYLVEYCISEGHSSMHYMDKVALRWSEDHITSVAQAKENAAERSKIYYGVMKAMGITGRRLIDTEVMLLRKWTGEYGFDLTLITEACSRTIASTNQPSFKYADSILTSWHKNNVKSMDDVKKLDADFNQKKASATPLTAGTTVKVNRNKFTNIDQREYDYDQLERIALTTSVQ